MAYAANYRRVGEAVLAIVATGAMFCFGNGLNPLWPLMWIAPLPVLVFALRSKWWATAMVTVAAMLLGNLNIVELLDEDAGDAGICVGGYLPGCECCLCSGSASVSCAGVAWRSAERTDGMRRPVSSGMR
jgi:hypothetical protein